MQPVFGCTFLADPFPADLAVSGGVYGQNESAELFLWDLSMPVDFIGRLGWQLDGGNMLSTGVFDVRQRAGLRQVRVGACQCV